DAIALSKALRARRPEIALGADLIAGFPTETEAMFEETLALVGEAGLSYVHAFPFSARRGTPAARMPQTSGAVIIDRARRLRAAGEAATGAFYDSLIGWVDDAIVESGGRWRLGNFAPMRAPVGAPFPVGAVVKVKVAGRDGETLFGAPVDE
ncbi:MAG: tRNA (N(6)-L-threonylcarbamoyladenosine(37)-C(2))-methylthiotransferase MtaB, partial [Parvularculaceae bacterium]|nr:tRNA (N(6)-L-threonylcarbamoyladenosine(37)-C(2))-methylthiotransferase MtaB [Parvularculaceae bacterium]